MNEIKDICINKLSKEPQDLEKSNLMWNKRAEEFSKLSNKTNEEGYIEFFKSHADIKNASIVDIGCGAGRYLKLLLDEGALVEGLEPSINMVDKAKKHLEKSGYDSDKIIIHNVAFQNFIPNKTYDYVFLSNSPASSYYENYQKYMKLAKKGIFIGSWLKRKDHLLEKLSLAFDKKAHSHNHIDLLYIFNLMIADGYFPSFETKILKNNKQETIDNFIHRYTSWIFGPEYSENNLDLLKEELKKYMDKDGKVNLESTGIKGMLYIDLTKHL